MKKLFFILSLCILTYSCESEESLPPQLESLSLEETTLYLNIGESYTLNFLTVPEEAVHSLTEIECRIQSGQNLDISNDFYYAANGITITPYQFGETQLSISGSYCHPYDYYSTIGNYCNLNGYRVSSHSEIIDRNRWSLSCKVIVGGNLEVTVPTDKITTTTAEVKCNENVIKNCSKIEISLSNNRDEHYWKTFYMDSDTDSFLLSDLTPGTEYSGIVLLYAKSSNGSYGSHDYIESKISFSTQKPEVEIATTFSKAAITLDEESSSACSYISISLTDPDDRTNSITTELYKNSSDEYTIRGLKTGTQYEGYMTLHGYLDSDPISISFTTKEFDCKMNLSYDRYNKSGNNYHLYLNLSLENDKTYADNDILYLVGCEFSDTPNFEDSTRDYENYKKDKNPQTYGVNTYWYGYMSKYYCRPFIELNSGEVIYGEIYQFDADSITLTKYYE